MFLPRGGLTPEEELIKAQQGVFDRLMKEDMEEYEKVAEEAAEELLTKAQEASVSPCTVFSVPCTFP